ncbi:MAG: archease, partial [Kiloniellales bacterium]
MNNKFRASAAATAKGHPKAMVSRWELFAHDADIGVRGFGPTMEAAFEQAACALTAVITDPRGLSPRQVVEIDCQVGDRELLLVEWLNALIYEMATRRLLFGRFSVHIQGTQLRARAWGEPVDVSRHQPA